MGWRNWPSWLKGGIILALIDFIILLIPLVKYFSNPNYYGESFGYLLVFTNPLSWMLSDLFEVPLNLPLMAFLGIILYFLVGSLIGWLIGKFKK